MGSSFCNELFRFCRVTTRQRCRPESSTEEHVAYSEAIARVLSGNYAIVGRRYEAR